MVEVNTCSVICSMYHSQEYVCTMHMSDGHITISCVGGCPSLTMCLPFLSTWTSS